MGRADPIRQAKSLKAEKCKPSQPQQHYTIDEMRGILLLLTGRVRERAIMALSFIGLRPAEILGLREEDIDHDHDVLYIRRSTWRSKTSDGGKSKRSRRTVPLGPTVTAILDDYRKEFPSAGGFIFENHLGRPLGTSGLEKLVHDVIRPTIEKHFTWKKLYAGRHGAITEVNRYTGGNTQTAAFMFGHTPEQEAETYLHELPDETRRAGLALDAALGNSEKFRDKMPEIQETVQ